MSKLIVELCEIESILPIEKADKLEVAQVKGWQCVVSKGQYSVGDIVIFVPPDSILPEKLIEKYNLEFLKKNGRVGTIKLRGQISQGLILDINCLSISKRHVVGQDVAEELGITKYEPPESNYSLVQRETFRSTFKKFIERKITFRRLIFKCFGLVKDKFKKKRKLNPLFDVYTDIDNINNYPDIFNDGEEVVITEKIHGTNVRYANLSVDKIKIFNFCIKKQKTEFCFGSHKVQLRGNYGKNCWYGEDVYGRIAERLNLAEKLTKGYIFYGEIYGKGIQDLTYGLDDIDVRFFDIKDTRTGRYLNYAEFRKICIELELKTVPLLYEGRFSKDILKLCTEGKSIVNTENNNISEGCVVKPVIERSARIGRVILKSINEEYLLRRKGTEFH